MNSTVPGRPDKRQRSRASQEGEKVLPDRLKLVPDGLEAVVNDLVASRAQTCKCEIDVRRLSLFIQFLADTALIQQGKPTHLDLSCMKHLPGLSSFTRSRSQFAKELCARHSHKPMKVQKFLHAAFRHFGDKHVWMTGVGPILEKMDGSDDSFEAALQELCTYMCGPDGKTGVDAVDLNTLSDGQ